MNNSGSNRSNSSNFHHRQRGVSLPIALMLLIPLTLLGITLANRNNLEELMASSQRDGQQSLMNAESGLSMGLQALDAMVVAQVAAEEKDETPVLTIDDLLDPNLYAGVVYYDGNALTNYALTQGTITVTVTDNDDGDSDLTTDADDRVILSATGYYNNGEREVEAITELVYEASGGSGSGPPVTIFTEDHLTISSTARVYGPEALVHSNEDVEIGGTTYIDGEITQADTGSVDSYKQAQSMWGDWATVDVTIESRIETPYIFPGLYKGAATYYMKANCDIYDGAPGYDNPLTGNNSVKIANGKDGWNGWKCDNDGAKNKLWNLENQTITGFYYVEGNLSFSGNQCCSGNPLPISIVAEGFIDLSGEVYIEPYTITQTIDNLTSGASEVAVNSISDKTWQDNVFQSQEIQLLAGGDMQIQGQATLDVGTTGIVATHDNLQASGTLRMRGALIAENSYYGSNSDFFGNIDSGERKEDQVTENVISGELYIHGSGAIGGWRDSGDPGDPAGAYMKGWREPVH